MMIRFQAILLASAVALFSMAVGCEEQPTPRYQPNPGGQPQYRPDGGNWRQPDLGRDPPPYRIPFRRNNNCNGPDCR